MAIGQSRKFSNSILFEFDTLVDLKIGLVKALQEDFPPGGPSNQILNFSFLHHNDEDQLKVIHTFNTEDILARSFVPKYKEMSESIYLDYLRDQYSRIIDLSPITNMVRLINTYNKTGYITSRIICKRDEEEAFVKKVIREPKIIRTDSEKSIDIKEYARIIISNIDDMKLFNINKMIGMHITVLNYAENFIITEEGVKTIDPRYIIGFSDLNEFEFLDPYELKEVYG